MTVFLDKLKCGQDVEPYRQSPLVLAYIGDCVYELFIRTYLITNSNLPVQKLHKRTTEYVNSKAQAEFYHRIKDKLSEEEESIYKRGRNAKSTVPKSSSLSDYKSATGIEALIGYLYLSGKEERIFELLRECID